MSKVKLIYVILLLFVGKFCSGQITSPAPYCNASYDDAAGFAVPHYISNVSIGTLSNATGAVQFAAPHYAYYNAIAAPSLTQGSAYTLSITHDGGVSIHFVVAYIDFNHNNSFSDPGERVLQQTIATGGTISNPATASVTIPATAVVGTTRMRIMVFEDDEYTWAAGNTNATPCTADATGTLDWGETEDYNVNIVASSSGCAAVTGLAATGITTSGATINWSAAAGAIGYEYVVNTTSSDPTGAGTLITGTSTPVTSLAPGTIYYVHVRTKCSGTSFSSWVTQSFTTLVVPACDSATGLSVSGITTTSANFNWIPVAGSAGYEYKVDMTAAAPTGTGTFVATNAASASALSSGTTYYVHVRNKCGAGSFSAWITRRFTTVIAPCDTVNGITLSGITTTSVTGSWGAVAGAVGYEYIISTSASITGAGTATTATTITGTSLSPSTLYYVHVRTTCPGGAHSAWITRSFTTQPIVICNPPTGLSVSGITTTKATVGWMPVSGSVGYEYAVTATPAAPSSSVSTTGTSVTFTALTPEVNYYAHVRNMCGGGNTSAWVTKPFKTTLGVSNVNNGMPAVNAYPNPITDVLTLKISGRINEGASIQVSDVAGKIIATAEVADGEVKIDMQKFVPGLYLIKYSSESFVQIIKVLKQ